MSLSQTSRERGKIPLLVKTGPEPEFREDQPPGTHAHQHNAETRQRGWEVVGVGGVSGAAAVVPRMSGGFYTADWQFRACFETGKMPGKPSTTAAVRAARACTRKMQTASRRQQAHLLPSAFPP